MILGAVGGFVGGLIALGASLNEKTRPTTGPGESGKYSALHAPSASIRAYQP
jgi:hypothetical protein